MKPRRENGSAISSEEVNFLVFRYLQESGNTSAAGWLLSVCGTSVLRFTCCLKASGGYPNSATLVPDYLGATLVSMPFLSVQVMNERAPGAVFDCDGRWSNHSFCLCSGAVLLSVTRVGVCFVSCVILCRRLCSLGLHVRVREPDHQVQCGRGAGKCLFILVFE